MWRSVPLVVAGILLGAMFIEPSVAHVTGRLGYLVKHLNSKFINAGESAGGSLTGSYSNPGIANNSIGTPHLATDSVTGDEIAADAVGSAEIGTNAVGAWEVDDDSLTGSDINEGSLGILPNADSLDGLDSSQFRTIARSATAIQCDPSTTTFIDCITVSLNLPAQGRVLVVATAPWDNNNSAAPNSGACRLRADTTTIGSASVAVGEATQTHTFTGNRLGTFATTTVTGILSQGAHNFTLQCMENESDIFFSEPSISAVAVSNL